MSYILLIDTTTTICSIALSKNNELVCVKENIDINSHAAVITLLIKDVLHQSGVQISEIDAVAISKGPGSYTGLRIGVSTAKGLCYAQDKPLLAINTLQSMAYGLVHSGMLFDDNTLFCPMLDARRMEVYNALFDKNCNFVKEVAADIIDTNIYLNILEQQKIVFFGNGSQKCKEILLHKNAIFIDHFQTSAKYLITLAYNAFINKEFENMAYFEPYYLKDFVATTPKNKF